MAPPTVPEHKPRINWHGLFPGVSSLSVAQLLGSLFAIKADSQSTSCYYYRQGAYLGINITTTFRVCDMTRICDGYPPNTLLSLTRLYEFQARSNSRQTFNLHLRYLFCLLAIINYMPGEETTKA